jgi:hypothetical protein
MRSTTSLGSDASNSKFTIWSSLRTPLDAAFGRGVLIGLEDVGNKGFGDDDVCVSVTDKGVLVEGFAFTDLTDAIKSLTLSRPLLQATYHSSLTSRHKQYNRSANRIISSIAILSHLFAFSSSLSAYFALNRSSTSLVDDKHAAMNFDTGARMRTAVAVAHRHSRIISL